MGRGLAFTISEDSFLAEHAETNTAKELFDHHENLREKVIWPQRSVKSLARRVERLRELGRIGQRNEETRRKAYFSRHSIRGE